MNLTETQIDLWFANEASFDFDELTSHCLDWLTERDVARYERFYFERHRKEFLLGKVLVRTVLSEYGGLNPSQWKFIENEYGKPALAVGQNGSSIYFNLSHSGDRLVMAVGKHEFLGIDIERSDRKRRVKKIADRYFSARELQPLLELEELAQQERFYDLWTLKEAYIKARGMGLALSLKQFGFDFETGELISLYLDPEMDDNVDGWQFWQLDAGAEYKLALAVKAGDLITNINSYHRSSLREYDTMATSITGRIAGS